MINQCGRSRKDKQRTTENLDELKFGWAGENVRMSDLVGTGIATKEGRTNVEQIDAFDNEFASLSSVDVELGGEDLFGHSGELFGLEEAELIPRR